MNVTVIVVIGSKPNESNNSFRVIIFDDWFFISKFCLIIKDFFYFNFIKGFKSLIKLYILTTYKKAAGNTIFK